MLVWLTLSCYNFCGFRSVAVNSVYKLQFFTFIVCNSNIHFWRGCACKCANVIEQSNYIMGLYASESTGLYDSESTIVGVVIFCRRKFTVPGRFCQTRRQRSERLRHRSPARWYDGGRVWTSMQNWSDLRAVRFHQRHEHNAVSKPRRSLLYILLHHRRVQAAAQCRWSLPPPQVLTWRHLHRTDQHE